MLYIFVHKKGRFCGQMWPATRFVHKKAGFHGQNVEAGGQFETDEEFSFILLPAVSL